MCNTTLLDLHYGSKMLFKKEKKNTYHVALYISFSCKSLTSFFIPRDFLYCKTCNFHFVHIQGETIVNDSHLCKSGFRYFGNKYGSEDALLVFIKIYFAYRVLPEITSLKSAYRSYKDLKCKLSNVAPDQLAPSKGE